MDLNSWYNESVNFNGDEEAYKDKLIQTVARDLMPFARGMKEVVKKTYWQAPDLLDDDLTSIIKCINKISDFVSNNSNFKLAPFVQKH